MTQVELVSLFWCLIFGGVLLGVLLSGIRMKRDEQREREKPDPEETEQ